MMQSRYMGGGCTKEVEPMCNHELSQTHQIEAYQHSEICAWPQISFFKCTLVPLPQIHLDRICKSIGKDATTSHTGLLYSVGPTGKQMHQLQNPMK